MAFNGLNFKIEIIVQVHHISIEELGKLLSDIVEFFGFPSATRAILNCPSIGRMRTPRRMMGILMGILMGISGVWGD
jgi:hypothetical protein